MCGIAGMVVLNKFERNKFQWSQIRFVFNELMVQTQERGKDATGIVHMRRDGAYDFYKSPTPATEVVTHDDTFKSIIAGFSPETASVIAHTRFHTKGSPKNNLNNHPFDIGNILGVHNGTIMNDDSLFKQFEFPRAAEVDSEIIFHLINKYNEQEVTLEGLKEALEKSFLRGLFAIAFAHKGQPNLVHIVKQEKPMTLTFWKEVGVMLYNSQDDLIDNAFDALTRCGNSFGFFPEVTVESMTLKDDTYITIDANAECMEDMVSDPKKIYLTTSTPKSGYYKDGTWVSGYNNNYNTGTGTGTNVGSSARRAVSALDSINRVIEGELDEESGEVIIFTTTREISTVGENDDGAEADENEAEICIECSLELDESEITASFNAGNPVNERVCKRCYEEAMQSTLGAGSGDDHMQRIAAHLQQIQGVE
jgi:glucosamine 6-phosphate synthetase-like amidotransferase/phosphosugar isomerase protein